jgi:hypothetical protein
LRSKNEKCKIPKVRKKSKRTRAIEMFEDSTIRAYLSAPKKRCELPEDEVRAH